MALGIQGIGNYRSRHRQFYPINGTTTIGALLISIGVDETMRGLVKAFPSAKDGTSGLTEINQKSRTRR